MLLAVCIIVCLVELWYYFNPPANQLMIPAYSAVLSGDFATAASSAQSVLSQSGSSLSSSDYTWAHLIIADSSALQATTTESQIAALNAILGDYHQLQDPFSRAWELDRFVEVAASANQATLSTVLSNDVELKSLLATSSETTTSNIAVYSYNQYPTSAAAYYAAYADSRLIFDQYSQRTNSSVSSKLTAAKTDALSWIQKGDTERALETQFATSSPYGPYAYTAWTDYYRSLPISAVALMDPTHMADARSNYQAIYDAYAQAQSTGTTYQQILLAVVPAEFNEAYLLYLSDPKANATEITNALKTALSLVQANPDALQKFIAGFDILGNPSSASSLGYNATEIAQLTKQHAVYVQMAAISPDLKAFLIARGWSLN